MLKEITPVNKIFVNASMSGTIAATSLISNIAYKDSVAYQYVWTGTPSGTFDVQGSVDYNPGQPQSNGAFNAGTWTSLVFSPIPQATGSGSSNVLINMNQLAFNYIKTVYTNSTGSGVLTGSLVAKSLG